MFCALKHRNRGHRKFEGVWRE